MINLKTLFNTKNIDTSRQSIKKTGDAFLLAGCFFGLCFFLFNSHVNGWVEWSWYSGFESMAWKWIAGTGLILYLTSRIAYPVMKPVHVAWMSLAMVLAWLSSTLLLTIYFYLVITPTGLFMKVIGKDLISKKIDSAAETYWVKRDQKPVNKNDFERLF